MTAPPTLPLSWNADDHAAATPFVSLLFASARLAYEPQQKGLRGFRDLGLDPEFIDRRPTQAYAAKAGRDALIAFRGTEGFGDVLTDLQFIRRHTNHGAVHSGFWEGYDRIHSAVADFGSKAARRGGRVWLTGHSLGGALAVVAAYRMVDDEQLPIGGVVTFGQPMVGMPSFAQFVYPLLHDRYICFVNGSDMIPNLVRPYVHFGQLVRYRQGSFWWENVRPGDEASKPSEVFAQAGASPLLEPLDDAQLDQMIQDLEAAQATTGGPDSVKMQGMIAWTADHSLAAYSDLVEAFAGRPQGSEQRS